MTAAEFRLARKALKLTFADVSRLFELNERTVRGWERGKRNGKPAPVPYAISLLMRLAVKHGIIRRELGIGSAGQWTMDMLPAISATELLAQGAIDPERIRALFR